MSEATTNRQRPQGAPSVFQTARDLYGAAFEPKTRAQVGEAMADWSELSEEERSFAIGHLLYLNLQAQAGSIRTLREIRDVLEDTDEAVQAMADELVSEDEDDDGTAEREEDAQDSGEDDTLVDGARDDAPPSPGQSEMNDDAEESLPREESPDER